MNRTVDVNIDDIIKRNEECSVFPRDCNSVNRFVVAEGIVDRNRYADKAMDIIYSYDFNSDMYFMRPVVSLGRNESLTELDPATLMELIQAFEYLFNFYKDDPTGKLKRLLNNLRIYDILEYSGAAFGSDDPEVFYERYSMERFLDILKMAQNLCIDESGHCYKVYINFWE
jgi:hypothetical protein